MSYVDLLRETITSQLDATEQCVRAAKSAAPGLVRYAVEAIIRNRIGPAAVVIPEDVIDGLTEQVTIAVQAALDTCLEHIASLREMAQFLGSPDELRDAADVLQSVGDAATGLEIRPMDLEGHLTWDDGDSKRYDGEVYYQHKNVERVPEAMVTFEEVLRTHADEIESYYLELSSLVAGGAMSIVGLVVAILGLIEAAAASGPGSLIGIVGAAFSLVEAALGVVVSAISVLQILVKSAQDSASKLDALDFEVFVWQAGFAQIK